MKKNPPFLNLVSIELRLYVKLRFCQRLNVHGIMLLKIQSSCRNSRYSQLIKLNTNYSASKSRCSNQSSGRKEGNLSSSSNNGRTSEAEEVFSFSTPIILNLLEQWSQTQIVRIVGLLVCAYLVIPSAGAVGALKTCSCLLKECKRIPCPDPAVLVENFNIADFTGKWFISSGLNPTIDTFDCQLHELHTEGGKLVGNLSWRIRTPDGGFFTRSTTQRFVQAPNYPVILYNHDNEYLHYQDGCVVVYTRNVVLPETIVPELERATQKVGRNFNKFIKTDNTYGPEPPLVERLEKKVEEGEQTLIREVEEIEGEVEKEVEKVGKTKHTLFQRLFEGFKELQRDKENFLKGLSKEEIELLNELKMEASEVEKLFGDALPIRKLR
ncbi:hypothetical protein V6N12_024061 [Hibiscus sabdariffa]|uniref:VDE lipocalin domain-containing protein n=1 Tax=Hibiscus sabdariffa TaxID=183260 RepID=A0ABR2FZH3_9ROSI